MLFFQDFPHRIYDNINSPRISANDNLCDTMDLAGANRCLNQGPFIFSANNFYTPQLFITTDQEKSASLDKEKKVNY